MKKLNRHSAQFSYVINFVRTILAALVLTVAYITSADDTRKLPTIGLAIPVDPATDAPFQKAFRDGLRDLGWVDGTNVTLIVRYSNGDPAKLGEIIRELIALRVDVLWGEAPALKEATTTIPIVSPSMGDPVGVGLVASLARPGGNLTGGSYQRFDTEPKKLQLAKELLPGLKRLCVLFDESRYPNLVNYLDSEFRAQARTIGVRLCLIPVRTLDDIRAVQRTIDKERPQAVMTWSSAFTFQHRHTLFVPVAQRLPVIAESRQGAELGAVLSYGVDSLDMFRRSAAYVDKILKGAKPADLPIQQPTKFDLVVNLKAAKALGIKVPESILVRADEIIQ